ncbi:MAG TPA: hypothetical protein VN673_03860, partial [Clostridia bacterium]|nr:hypothetical protein [Clostridia bacterium]
YEVTRLGPLTVVTWLRPPGPGTPTAVLVDYDAEPVPPGSYDTFTQSYLVRFELWKNLLGIYGRLTLSDNNAREDLRVQEFINYAVGTDFTWRGLRAGAEYQVYDSTDSDYRSVRLFQSYGFRPDPASSLTVDFNQMWIEYQDSGRHEEDYRFVTRYYRTLARQLGLSLEGGVSLRRGDDEDQLLATFRPSIKYVIGRTTIDAGYWYQYELFLNREERHKHMLSFRIKRVF